MPSHVPPAIDAVSFSCPHCGAHASQSWFDVRLQELNGTPFVPDAEWVKLVEAERREHAKEALDSVLEYGNKLMSGKLSLEEKGDYQFSTPLLNLYASRCYACKEFAIWKHSALLFPAVQANFHPNVDLPDDIKADFREADAILMTSPRGAAALLRLSVQKLCSHLGGPEATIDKNIAWLVGKGLDEHVQQALDAVRVIGNEAVHPGELDLRDDVQTAASLFDLVNVIAEEMISRKKRIAAVYDKLPQSKKDGIDARNAKVRPNGQ